MKRIDGFTAQERIGGKEMLPAGGYIAKILDAHEKQTQTGKSMLEISFDITAGEYAGFFKKDYAQNSSPDKKWRGVYRLFVPVGDGSERDSWSKNTLENTVWAIEESNPGYHWDWDETKLKGKNVGVLFRDKEWEYNGNTGITTECGAFTTVEKITSKTFKPLKAKMLKKQQIQENNPFSEMKTLDDDFELPF